MIGYHSAASNEFAYRLAGTLGLPPPFVGGFFLSGQLARFGASAFDFVSPFIITFWFGLLFSNGCYFFRREMAEQQVSNFMLAVMGGGAALLSPLAICARVQSSVNVNARQQSYVYDV